MLKCLVFLALILPVTAVAQVKVFYPYAEWDGWPDEYRTVYIAGTLDTISTLVVGEQVAVAVHYNMCMRRAHMTALDVANNLREYVRTHPEWHDDSVQGALLHYLIELCGTPKD